MILLCYNLCTAFKNTKFSHNCFFYKCIIQYVMQWSFGVVCWEVLSLGKQPYPGIEHQHILEYIESGNRLPKTALCKDEM